MKEKIRDISAMSVETKLRYFNILAIMAAIDEEINQLEMMELYRMAARFKLLHKERLTMLEDIGKNHDEIMGLCEGLLEDLNDQERNIVRFSLMKDLIIIMKADYYEAPEEKKLLHTIKVFFKITEEQMDFFFEEYQQDRSFSEEEVIELYDGNKRKERILTATAIGIPIAAIYVIEGVKKNKSSFIQTFTKRLSNMDYLKAIGLGMISYEIVKGLLKHKDNNESRLKQHLMKDSRKLQERAIRYLILDIANLQQKLQEENQEGLEAKYLKEKIVLLEKTLASFHNTKPQLL
ncbi:hypothetical protein [Natronincola peptidivorans]|nr:hypothetical protein [Natronincola peptidivorans]